MQDQGIKENEKLRGRIRPLVVIANVTPLLGLLGTVLGIMEAFSRVVKTGLGKPEHLAGGIEEALVTTFAGLAVAIPAMLIAAWLTGRVRRFLLLADETVSPAVESLAQRRGTSHAA
jgi:biopolymer transport protein ExbB